MEKTKPSILKDIFSFVLYVSIATSLFLFILGGIVRVTGSGLGCPDWPLCYGQLFPPLELKAIIEYTHRFVAIIFGLFLLFVCTISFLLYRNYRIIILISGMLFVSLIFQGLLGAYTVISELNPWIVTLHLTNGYLLIGFLIVLKILTTCVEGSNKGYILTLRTLPKNFLIVNLLLVCFLFLVSVSGAYLRGEQVSFQCLSWPLCHSELIPENTISKINMLHRYIVGLFTFYIIWVGYLGYKLTTINKISIIKNILVWTMFLYVIQIIIGAIMALTSMNAVLRVIHLFASSLTWALVISYVTMLIVTKEKKDVFKEIDNNE